METSKKSCIKLTVAIIFVTRFFYTAAGSFATQDILPQECHEHLEMLAKVTFASFIQARMLNERVNDKLMVITLVEARNNNIKYQPISEYHDYTLKGLDLLYRELYTLYWESALKHQLDNQPQLLSLLERNHAYIFGLRKMYRTPAVVKLRAARKRAILRQLNENHLSISEIEPQNLQE